MYVYVIYITASERLRDILYTTRKYVRTVLAQTGSRHCNYVRMIINANNEQVNLTQIS